VRGRLRFESESKSESDDSSKGFFYTTSMAVLIT